MNPRQSKSSKPPDQFGDSQEGGVKAGYHFSDQNFNSFETQKRHLSEKNEELIQQSIKSSFDENISNDSNVSQHMKQLKGNRLKQMNYKDKSEMRQREVKKINGNDWKQQEIQNTEHMKEFNHLNKSESIKNLKSFILSDGQLNNQMQTVHGNDYGSNKSQLENKLGHHHKNISSSQTHIKQDNLFSDQIKIQMNNEQEQSDSEIHKDQASSEKKISVSRSRI